jgi:hypothetical protein
MTKNKLSNKMRVSKRRLLMAFALTLIFSFTASMLLVEGQIDLRRSMSATVGCFPNPVGVNQRTLVEGFLNPQTQTYGDVYRNLNFTITAPDGTKSNVVQDASVGGEYDFYYTPTQVGTYRIQLFWAGDTLNKPATSSNYALTVQSTQVATIAPIVTYAYLSESPDPCGVGETVYLVGWIAPARELTSALYYPLTATVTKPDGSKITYTHYTNSEGTMSFSVACNLPGTYTAKLSYAGNELHKASESPLTTWTALANFKAPTYPTIYPPNNPWDFPISSENYEWYQISGAWAASAGTFSGENYDGSNWNPWTWSPNSPHVLWKLQTSEAGLIGGSFGAYTTVLTATYGTGAGIEGKTSTFVEAHGRIFYTQTEGATAASGGVAGVNLQHPVLHCVDQKTGKEIYKVDIPTNGTAAAGGSLYLEIYNTIKIDPQIAAQVPGAFSLWISGGGTWEVNPWNGNVYWMTTQYAATYYGGGSKPGLYYSYGGNLTKLDPRSKSIIWTKPTTYITGSPTFDGDIIWTSSQSSGMIPNGKAIRSWSAVTGESICNGTDTGIMSDQIGNYISHNGKAFYQCVDRYTYAIDLTTGKLAWKSSEPADYPWGSFGTYGATVGAGLVMEATFDGRIWAYDENTGVVKWKTERTENNSDFAAGHPGTWSQIIIANDKVYYSTGEHSPPNPYPRGGKLYCVSLADGHRIWSLDGFYNKAGVTNYGGIANGILWYASILDGSIWFIGKGETETSVSASPKVIANGGSVLVEGLVIDKVPGEPTQTLATSYIPAVSDDSQVGLMEYLWNGKPLWTNMTGVQVSLVAIDESGGVTDIGTVRSDSSGHYKYLWTPTTKGTYTIAASFPGSDSYYSSYAETSVGVTAAVTPIVTPTPTSTTAPTPTPIVTSTVPPTASPTTPTGPGGIPTSTVYAIAAAVIIIIVIAIAALVLRRRK